MTTLSTILVGCVTRPLGPGRETLSDAVSGRAGRRGFVVSAPDAGTGSIATEIARRTGFGLVVATESGARREDGDFERRVREVAQGALLFYTEIHGNDHHDAGGRIEIAAVGVDREEARRLRTLLELIRDAHLPRDSRAPRLDVLVEPADPLRPAARSAKRDDLLRLSRHALHVELPRAARDEWCAIYTAVLADFLAQAASLLGAR